MQIWHFKVQKNLQVVIKLFKSIKHSYSKHQNTIRVLEGRYQKVAREQGVMSKEALELKEKILQEKATLGQLDNQYKKTTMEAKRFAFEQKH